MELRWRSLSGGESPVLALRLWCPGSAWVSSGAALPLGQREAEPQWGIPRRRGMRQSKASRLRLSAQTSAVFISWLT